jgi:hypothetical protein
MTNMLYKLRGGWGGWGWSQIRLQKKSLGLSIILSEGVDCPVLIYLVIAGWKRL